jgi:ABC-2 type transport system permease protein
MRAALALARREVIRFVRQPSRVVGALLPPVLAWVLIGAGFGESFRVPGVAPGAGESYFAYFYPGTVVLVVLFASIFATISVIEDRREGFLQAVVVSPASPLAVASGKVLGGTVLSLVQGGALLLFVPVLGLPVRGPDLALAVAVLVLLSLALTGLGFSIAWSLESTQGFHAIMNLFLFPLWFLSGAFFPASSAPVWLRAVMAANPLTYGVAALRTALSPAPPPGLPSPGLSLAVTTGFALAMLALSAAVVARNPAGPEKAILGPRGK